MASWRQCAECYLSDIWFPHDRQLMSNFSAGAVTCEALHDLCCRYSVARTIPGKIEELGLEKYRPFMTMLNKHRPSPMTHESVPSIIDTEVENLGKAYGGKRPWSAVSKAFWMMKQHPVVIFDNFAWKGLQKLGLSPGYNTYREYFDSWFRFFELADTKRGLDDAVEWLPSSPKIRSMLASRQISEAELGRMTESAWLRNRVTDVKLCCEGGAKWIGAERC